MPKSKIKSVLNMESENEILITITKQDLQVEAAYYLGREMNEEEYLLAKNYFNMV